MFFEVNCRWLTPLAVIASAAVLAGCGQNNSYVAPPPPQVTVAVNKSRYLIDWLKDGSSVTLNQIAKGDNSLFKHFSKGFEPDANAFDGLQTTPARNGLITLPSAMASLEGTVSGQMDAGDHRILLVTITDALHHREPTTFEPFVHVRKNGFGY